MELSIKQQRFIDFYDGNGTDAARKAGYKGTDKALSVLASRMLGKSRIREAVEARNKKKGSRLIATREQRQEFWTSVMSDTSADLRDRLKASELLGRSESDFVEKIEHSGTITLEKLLCGEVVV